MEKVRKSQTVYPNGREIMTVSFDRALYRRLIEVAGEFNEFPTTVINRAVSNYLLDVSASALQAHGSSRG